MIISKQTKMADPTCYLYIYGRVVSRHGLVSYHTVHYTPFLMFGGKS